MSTAYRLLTAFCLLGVALSVRDAVKQRRVLVGPDNDAFEFGPSTTLQCQVSGPNEIVQWMEYVTNPAGSPISVNNQTLSGHPNFNRYSILWDDVARTYDLVINPTTLGDGGLYRCMDTSDLSVPAYAQIVTLDGRANCTTNVPPNGFVTEGVYYSIECYINYKGIGPNITWTGPPETTGAPWGVASIYANNTVWAGVNMNMSRFFSGYNFNATVNFNGQGFVGIPNQANNIPGYGYMNIFPNFYVRWAPGRMYVSPDGPYEIGQVIECWADAFPDSTYFWQNTVTNQVINGQFLTATAALAGTTRFRCNANNGIGANDLFVNITVNPVTESTTPTTTQTTTTPPAEGVCNDLTGRWRATSPSAVDLCIEVNSTNGQVIGLFRNATDPYFIEVRGSVQPGKYDEIGFAGVWPVNIGTQAFTGVCSNCFGTEHLQINAAGRRITDFANCVNFGQIYYSNFYNFARVGPPCRGLFAEYGIKI